MNALSHLSPDVLEVVRDVARQEDSFLLRVQGVPLAAFTDANAPRLGPRAPFLSSAERHILEYCRDETAYLFELALFLSVTDGERPDSTQIATVADPDRKLAESFAVVQSPHLVYPAIGANTSLFSRALTSPHDLRQLDWRVLTRSALTLRISSSALTNAALAMTRSGMLEDSRQALRRVIDMRPGPWPDLYATVGYQRFMSGSFKSAARAYSAAFRLHPDDRLAACALLNQCLAGSASDSDMESFARSLEGDRLSRVTKWLRDALQSAYSRGLSKPRVEQAGRAQTTNKVSAAEWFIGEVLR